MKREEIIKKYKEKYGATIHPNPLTDNELRMLDFCISELSADNPSLPSKEQVINVLRGLLIAYVNYTDYDVNDCTIGEEEVVDKFLKSNQFLKGLDSAILSLSPVEGKEENLNDTSCNEVYLLRKVIEKYQFFTRWVLKHTPEIKESERGLNHLNDIDWAEHKVKEFEQSSEPKDNNAGQSDEKSSEPQRRSAEEFIDEKIKNYFLPIYDKADLINWLNEFASQPTVTDLELEVYFNKWIVDKVGIQDSDIFSKGSLVRDIAIEYAKAYRDGKIAEWIESQK